MRYLFCPICFLILSVFMCCTKSTKKQVAAPVNLNADFKDYFNYQPGSYWVFIDSPNLTRDSFYIVSYLDSPASRNSAANEAVKIIIRDSSFTLAGAPLRYEDWTLSLTSQYYSLLSIESVGTNLFFDTLTSNMPFSTDSFSNAYSYRLCSYSPTFSVNYATYSTVYNVLSTTNGISSILMRINHDNGFLRINFGTNTSRRDLCLLSSHVVR